MGSIIKFLFRVELLDEFNLFNISFILQADLFGNILAHMNQFNERDIKVVCDFIYGGGRDLTLSVSYFRVKQYVNINRYISVA